MSCYQHKSLSILHHKSYLLTKIYLLSIYIYYCLTINFIWASQLLLLLLLLHKLCVIVRIIIIIRITLSDNEANLQRNQEQ